MGIKSDQRPAGASRCLRDEGVRSIYQLACVVVCRVRSLGLVLGHRPILLVCER